MTATANPLAIVSNTLQVNKAKIGVAIGKLMPPERFISITLDAFRKNPKLLDCDQQSIWNAIISAANAGLLIGGVEGQAYLVPYGKECQLLPSYKGLMHLARKAGCKKIVAECVHEGDLFEQSDDPLNPAPRWKASDSPNRHEQDITHVFAIYVLETDEVVVHVMTKGEVDRHGKAHSKSFNDKNGPWQKHWRAMALKTVLKWPINRGFVPLTTIGQHIVATDDVFEGHVEQTYEEVPVDEVPLEQLVQQTPPYEESQQFGEDGNPINS